MGFSPSRAGPDPGKEEKTDHCRISVPQPSGRPFYFSGGISDPETLEYIAAVLRQFRA
ncbi:MAG: hypothetical protein ACLT8E_00660 [Akkermansia sp.]